MDIRITDMDRARWPHHSDRERIGLKVCERIDTAARGIANHANRLKDAARGFDGERPADLRLFAGLLKAIDAHLSTVIEGCEHILTIEKPWSEADNLVDYASEVSGQAARLEEKLKEPEAVWSPKLEKTV